MRRGSLAGYSEQAQDLYLVQRWELDEDDWFREPAPGTLGVWVPKDNIASLEFYRLGPEPPGDDDDGKRAWNRHHVRRLQEPAARGPWRLRAQRARAAADQPAPQAWRRWRQRASPGPGPAEEVTSEDWHIEHGWGRQPEKKGMGPNGKPLTEPVK